jgi:hypothetical protein
MNEQIDERLRSYYRDLQAEPPAALQARVVRAFAAAPAPRPARALSRPALGFAAVAAAAILLIVALVARSLSPAPSPSGVVGPSGSASPSAPSGSPSAAVTPNGTLPNLPAVPTGKWTGLEWFVLPDGMVPASTIYGSGSYVDLFGWSGGYVDFVWDGRQSVVPWASADGLHWQAGPKLPPGEFPIRLPRLGTSSEWCDFEVDSFVEARAGLLAHARLVCQGLDSSGSGTTLYSATWASADGLTWTAAANVPDGELSVGGAGYLATDGQHVWVSQDGSAWQSGSLPGQALPGTVRWGHPIAFAGGFILAPETSYTQWMLSDNNYPVGTPTGVFWSADGRTWSRQDPPGAPSGLTGLWLDKIDDNLLLLREETFDKAAGKWSATAWTSVDGRAWKQMARWTGIDPLNPGSVVNGVIELNGAVAAGLGHAVVVHHDQGMDQVYGFDPATRSAYDLSPTLSQDTLSQAEGYPALSPYGHGLALGPSGLLATDEQGRLWIGVPTVSGLYPTGAMSPALSQPTATRLIDGRVLIAGGMETLKDSLIGVKAAAAEIYDPATGKFTPTGSMNDPRVYFTATLLDDGKVLVVGGADLMDGIDNLASAEIYDPATGKFTRTGSMAHGRAKQTATPLADGRVLIAGGYGGGTAPLTSAEIYDPATGKFTATGSMKVARSGATATLLADLRVLIAGGQTNTAAGVTASAEIYDPATGRFTATGSMAAARYGHSASDLWAGWGWVLITGGRNAAGTALASAEIYDPATGKFRAVGSMTVAAETLDVTLDEYHCVAVAGNTLETYTYDTATGGVFTAGPALMAAADTATVLRDGRLLLTEGGLAQLYQP